ncbi:MAG: TetR/AcrR family transcriptional regulator [Sediminimonas sp.]|uniref:TetR/AcrR family transcriptional regulator n=1 Tax=Sediminimonas sp. TaxID=2823379 RepID=UPI00287070CD|nr:TetR/AcrR family transcriptional regulator [Sediminimonas sp.]MDR9484426.1 TetR/AcrR family transcriptional regulator [Sediminimonas sp.]
MTKESLQSDTTRDRVLSTSAGLFCQHGYAGVSMRKIAESCEMKAGSLYYHFASKDEILIEVLNMGIERVHAAVATALSESAGTASAFDRLRHAISGHLHALLEYSSFTSANVRIFRQVPEAVQHSTLETRRRYEALWDGFLGDLKAEGHLRSDVDIRSFRLMLIGALNATLDWFDPEPGDISELVDRYADMLANGILVGPQS